jgi:hypothetical protein
MARTTTASRTAAAQRNVPQPRGQPNPGENPPGGGEPGGGGDCGPPAGPGNVGQPAAEAAANFSLTPGQNLLGVIDYSTKSGMSHYKSATAKLEKDPYDCNPDTIIIYLRLPLFTAQYPAHNPVLFAYKYYVMV